MAPLSLKKKPIRGGAIKTIFKENGEKKLEIKGGKSKRRERGEYT